MIKQLLFGFALAFLGVSSIAWADFDTRTPVMAEISPYVAMGKGCTGWHVGAGFVVTASHCVTPLGDRAFLEIVLSNEQTLKGANIAFLANNEANMDDFAVLKVGIPKRVDWAYLDLSCSVPPVRTEVTITGFPAVNGGYLTTNWGHVSTELVNGFDGGHWLHGIGLDLTASGGYSGSPVQRLSDNRVVGVLVGAAPTVPYAVMIPTKKICAVLELTEGHVE